MTQRIGVDLRVLQIGHQFRGIGEHVKSLIKYFPEADGFDQTEFRFYAYDGLNDPTEGIKASLRNYGRYQLIDAGPSPKTLGRGLSSFAARLRDDRHNVSEEQLAQADVDAMLFFDFQLGVPASAPYRSTLIMYDLIPYLFPDGYYRKFSTQLRSRAEVRSATDDAYLLRHYRRSLQRATTNADKILTISEHTRRDLTTHLGVESSKMQAVLLGVEPESDVVSSDVDSIKGVNTDTTPVEVSPEDIEYVLYIGGSDFRRQLPHLLEAFELARRQLPDLKLVLAGADFTSIDGVHHTQDPAFKEALLTSKAGDDVYFLGYISDAERSALYHHALAFIYPTIYEGFGLPILESMAHRCPTITFNNSSTPEVGGDAAFYTESPAQSADYLINLARDPELAASVRHAGLAQAQRFPWAETARVTFAQLTSP